MSEGSRLLEEYIAIVETGHAFHDTSVGQQLRRLPGVTVNFYCEVMSMWNRYQGVRSDNKRLLDSMEDIMVELDVIKYRIKESARIV